MSKQDEFDYSVLNGRYILPDTQLSITGEEFHLLVNKLLAIVNANTGDVVDNEGKFVGTSIPASIRPILSLHDDLMYTLFKRFYDQGLTLSFEEFQAEVKARAEKEAVAAN